MRFPATVAAGAFAATLAASTPATAAEADENLDCIVFLATAMGTVEDPTMRIGIASAMGWYIGHYEAQTGKPLGEELVERTKMIDEDEMNAIQQKCLPPMVAFGERLSALGQRILEESRE